MIKKKIVIIDDEEDLCNLMKTYLVDLNHEVFLANTLVKGLSLIKEVSPDVVFMDNNLPDGLGWEKMKFISTEYPFCKINLISAYKYFPPDVSVFPSVQIIEKPLSLSLIKDYL